jgi:hypothetical protein
VGIKHALKRSEIRSEAYSEIPKGGYQLGGMDLSGRLIQKLC